MKNCWQSRTYCVNILEY